MSGQSPQRRPVSGEPTSSGNKSNISELQAKLQAASQQSPISKEKNIAIAKQSIASLQGKLNISHISNVFRPGSSPSIAQLKKMKEERESGSAIKTPQDLSQSEIIKPTAIEESPAPTPSSGSGLSHITRDRPQKPAVRLPSSTRRKLENVVEKVVHVVENIEEKLKEDNEFEENESSKEESFTEKMQHHMFEEKKDGQLSVKDLLLVRKLKQDEAEVKIVLEQQLQRETEEENRNIAEQQKKKQEEAKKTVEEQQRKQKEEKLKIEERQKQIADVERTKKEAEATAKEEQQVLRQRSNIQPPQYTETKPVASDNKLPMPLIGAAVIFIILILLYGLF